MILDHAKKHRIAFLYYIENLSYIEVMRKTGIPMDTIKDWCKEVINNPNLSRIYLPSDFFKNSNNGLFLGRFNGYYEGIKEDNIKTNLPGELFYDKTNIDNERCAPVFDEGSFSERIQNEKYKVGRELNARKPVIMQSKINTKEWERQSLLNKLKN